MAQASEQLSGHPAPRIDRRGMPCEFDAGVGSRARIGLIVLASDQTLEYEFRLVLRNLPGVALYESRIYNANEITPATLKAMEDGLSGATALLVPGVDLATVAYACTSGSMVIGDGVVRDRIHDARPGVATTTPMQATFAAFRALGARRVAYIAPYQDNICQAMRGYILDNGFEVPVMGSWNQSDDVKVARISPASIRDAVLELGAEEDVDAAFVACTSLRLVEQVEALEQALGKPVTSSNHALIWHCLRLSGVDEPLSGYGSLYRRTAV